MEGGGDPPQGRKEPPGVQVGSAPAAQAWDAHHAPHPHPYAPVATDPPANERQGVVEIEWWDAKYVMWPRQEVGKGQGRGASKPAWRPAQNADSGWGPANPRMQVGRGSQRVRENDRKGWMPRDQWEAREGGKAKEGQRKLASETETAFAASTTSPRPGPSPGRTASPSAPVHNPSMPREGMAQGPMARNVPTERGLASARVDGQAPPTNSRGIKYSERVVSDQEKEGGHHHHCHPYLHKTWKGH